MSANHPWIVSRAMNGRLLLSRKPARFRICAGVSFRLECSERARFGRSDISMATKCFSGALDRLYRYHKKAEAIQKRGERFTKDLSLGSALYRVLLTDNCQPIRPAGSDPAGTLTVVPFRRRLNRRGRLGSARLSASRRWRDRGACPPRPRRRRPADGSRRRG